MKIDKAAIEENAIRRRVHEAGNNLVHAKEQLAKLIENRDFLRDEALVVELGARAPYSGWVKLQRDIADAKLAVENFEAAGIRAAKDLDAFQELQKARAAQPSNVIPLKKRP